MWREEEVGNKGASPAALSSDPEPSSRPFRHDMEDHHSRANKGLPQNQVAPLRSNVSYSKEGDKIPLLPRSCQWESAVLRISQQPF